MTFKFLPALAVSEWEQVKAKYWAEYLSCDNEAAKNEVISQFLKDHPQAINIEFIMRTVAGWIETRNFDCLDRLRPTKGQRRSETEKENEDLYILEKVKDLLASGRCTKLTASEKKRDADRAAFNVVAQKLNLSPERIKNRYYAATRRKPRFFYEVHPDGSYSFGYAPVKVEIHSPDGKILKAFGAWRFDSKPGALLK